MRIDSVRRHKETEALLEQVTCGIDDKFLDWLRSRSEDYWATLVTPTIGRFEAEELGAPDFQGGTRWACDLDENAISVIEMRIGLRFPPDYRLFLKRLHTTDRPLIGALTMDDGRMVLEPFWEITNWTLQPNPVASVLEHLTEVFATDAAALNFWHWSWGPPPEAASERRHFVTEALARAPRLIPVHGSTFLIADPCSPNNPVISIMQSDVIAFGLNLREYLGFSIGGIPLAQLRRGEAEVRTIPFWGDLTCMHSPDNMP